MLPLGVFRSRQFSAANLSTLFVYAGLAMVFFLIGLELQEVLGYSPLEAGAATLPVTAMMLRVRPPGPARWRSGSGRGADDGRAADRRRRDAADDPHRRRARATSPSCCPAVLVFGAGLALTVAPLTATVLAAAADGTRASRQASTTRSPASGALLAVAAVPLIAGFDPGVPVGADALVSGFHTALVGAATLATIGAMVSFVAIRADTLNARPGRHRCDTG